MTKRYLICAKNVHGYFESKQMRILGIDPGLHITGWGVIDYDGYHLKHVSHGTIVTKADDVISFRLNKIYKGLSDVVEDFSPTEVGIEQVFVNSNPNSSLKLGMARGTAICCVGVLGLPVAEYTPNKVKKSVVGVGHATKDQVSTMVQILLNCGAVKLDAADALAIAVCHAHNRGIPNEISQNNFKSSSKGAAKNISLRSGTYD